MRKKIATAAGVAVLLALALLAGRAGAEDLPVCSVDIPFDAECYCEEPPTEIKLAPFWPLDAEGIRSHKDESQPGLIRITRPLFNGDNYPDTKFFVHWERSALLYHPKHEVSVSGTFDWPRDQTEVMFDIGGCSPRNGVVRIRYEFHYGANSVHLPGWTGFIYQGQLLNHRMKWDIAQATVAEECYEHPADIPLEQTLLLNWWDDYPKEITAFWNPNTLPTKYDVEVQLTEYGNWNDPSTYRTMIQTRDRVGTKAVKFTAGAHNLENLQMYIVRARAFDPEDGRRGEWTSWKQIYYFGFDRYIYARYGDVRPVNLPELPAAFGSSPLPNGNEMDEYTADAVEAVPDPETVARIEQAMADDAAVNAPPQIAPAPSDSLINPPEEETAEEPPPDDVVWAQPIDVDPGYEYPPEEEGAWEDDDDPYEEPSEEEDEWWGDDPTDGDDQDDWS